MVDDRRLYGWAWRPRPQTVVTAQMIVGVVVIALGALWTLDNFNVLESEPITRWWPLIPIAVGLAKILGLGTLRSVPVGGIMVFVGLWLLAGSLGYAEVRFKDLIPLALVFIGFGLLRRGMGTFRGGPAGPEAVGLPGAASVGEGTAGGDIQSVIQSFAFMSGVDR